MRSYAVPAVVALLAATVQATNFLAPQSLKLDTAAGVVYDPSLLCSSCVRGGFQFCKYTNGTASACREHEDDFTGDEFVCSGFYADQFNAINNFCYLPKGEDRPAECTDYNSP